MQTTLPDLPFTGYGDATTPIFHSSASASPRKYPRTDLKTLIPWTSFIDDVHQAIQSATALVELSSTLYNREPAKDKSCEERREATCACGIRFT